MKKYKIMGIAVIVFIVLAVVTLSLGPTWNVGSGEKSENPAADVMLWVTFGYVVAAAAAGVGYKIYALIKYKLLHKKREEDTLEFAVKNRSKDYRDKINY